MCATLGIRQGFSQAYHHQANGRAEMAGQQILEKLRKMLVGGNFCWVELLPAALDRIHDTPGESGLSLYQIVLGGTDPWLISHMNTQGRAKMHNIFLKE